MAMSGVTIDNACIDAYTTVKNGKSKYCIFRIADNEKSIIVDENECPTYKRNANPEDFESFRSQFPSNKCRYGIFISQLACCGSDGIKGYRDKIIFITWAPDTARIKDKMMIAASKEAIKKSCVGIHYDFQFSCEADSEASEWIEKIGEAATMKIAGDIVEFEGRPVGDW